MHSVNCHQKIETTWGPGGGVLRATLALFVLACSPASSDALQDTTVIHGESDGTHSAETSAASEPGDSEDSGNLPPMPSDDALDEVEDACDLDCAAMLGTECPPQHHNQLTCKLQCAAITVQLGDFCLEEYAQLVRCRGEGGYQCYNDYPTPRINCLTESQTFYECSSDLGCKRFCQASVASGCDASFGTCVDACVAHKQGLNGSSCAIYLDQLYACHSYGTVTCDASRPSSSAACPYSVGNVADCIARDDTCQGYCFMADHYGCGSGDCQSSCEERVNDTACGWEYRNWLSCSFRRESHECRDGQVHPVGDDCSYDRERYETCLNG